MLPILAVFGGSPESGLSTARGSLLRPKFELLPTEEVSEISGDKELLCKGESVRALLLAESDGQPRKKRKDDSEPVVLHGADGAEPAPMEGTDVFDEDLDIEDIVPRAKGAGAGESTSAADLPLGERLKSLNLAAPSQSSSGASSGNANKPAKLPPASLLALLTQALRTSDPSLLESCLATAHLPTIRTTLTKLPTPWILPLLSAIESRIRARPARTRGLLPWLRTAMIVHAGYLVSHPSIPPRLASLESLLRARLGVVGAMYGLLGRLEVAMSAVDRRRETSGEMDEEEGMAVYREDEDEGDDGGEGAEGEWEALEEEDAFAEVGFERGCGDNFCGQRLTFFFNRPLNPTLKEATNRILKTTMTTTMKSWTRMMKMMTTRIAIRSLAVMTRSKASRTDRRTRKTRTTIEVFWKLSFLHSVGKI